MEARVNPGKRLAGDRIHEATIQTTKAIASVQARDASARKNPIAAVRRLREERAGLQRSATSVRARHSNDRSRPPGLRNR